MALFAAVVIVWTTSSVLAMFGALYLARVAFRDWRIAGATPNPRRRTIRRETAGIFLRSGIIRAATTFLFAAAGFMGATHPEPVDLVTATISITLSAGTFAVTVRDIIARARIAKASG